MRSKYPRRRLPQVALPPTSKGSNLSLPDSIRPARATDHDAIDTLLQSAFPGPQEAKLTRALRAEGCIESEYVMPWQDGIAGHLALSHLRAPLGWLALAPVAIDPRLQGRQLGSRLVAMAVKLALIKGQTVVVLGKPSFYARAGFSQARAQSLTTNYPLEYLLLARPGADQPVEALIYPAAFDLV